MTLTSSVIAGDELIKIWKPTASKLTLLATLESTSDAVLTIAARDSTIFAGHQGGVIKVRSPLTRRIFILTRIAQIWDLDTFICVRNLKSQNVRLDGSHASER